MSSRCLELLGDFVRNHALVSKEATDGDIDMVFFRVSVAGEPDAETLRELVRGCRVGYFANVDPWDGQEHSYLELGGWIGDQGLALSLMGLGHLLGLWKVMTPRMLDLPDDLVLRMAESGMVLILPHMSADPV